MQAREVESSVPGQGTSMAEAGSEAEQGEYREVKDVE